MVLKQVRQHDKTDKLPLGNLVKSLYLPTFASQYQSVAESFEQDGKTYTDYLQELAIRELEHRHQQHCGGQYYQIQYSHQYWQALCMDYYRLYRYTCTDLRLLLEQVRRLHGRTVFHHNAYLSLLFVEGYTVAP